MIDRWRRLLRRTRPDVRWYWDIRCKTVPPGQSRRILRWPVCEWHQQTSVNRKQRCWTYFPTHQSPLSHLPLFHHITHFRSESLFSYLTAPSVTIPPHANQPSSTCGGMSTNQHLHGNVPKVSGRCLNKPTSRTYIHSYTALCLIYSIYTCIHSAYSYNKCTTSGHFKHFDVTQICSVYS